MKNNNNSYVEIEGYKNWIPYFEFSKDLYSDLRTALVQKDFEMAKRCMRELIDNTVPYHNQRISIVDEEETHYFDYNQYFELNVENYEAAIQREQNRHLTPDDKEEISQQKDSFYQQIRYIRRLIMQDLSRAGIIPTASTKKEQKVNKLLREE